MKIFLDTANVEQIREANSWGIIDGVTTNPSLIAKEGRDFREVVEEICSIVNGPISTEVISLDAAGMVKEGKELAKIHGNINIKVPMTPEGLKAVKELSSRGIKTNVTLIFSANQALLAAKAGASFVSPFVGRIDDTGHDGMQVVHDIVQIYLNYAYDTEIIAASVRHPIHVLEAAKAGAHISTIPWNVLQQMTKHPQTDLGIAAFLKDWEKVPKAKK